MGLLAFLKTQFVVHLLIGFVFVVSGLIINFIQLCTLVLWPVNKQLYRRLNCRLAYSLWSREYRVPRGLGTGRSGGPVAHPARGPCAKALDPGRSAPGSRVPSPQRPLAPQTALSGGVAWGRGLGSSRALGPPRPAQTAASARPAGPLRCPCAAHTRVAKHPLLARHLPRQ